MLSIWRVAVKQANEESWSEPYYGCFPAASEKHSKESAIHMVGVTYAWSVEDTEVIDDARELVCVLGI